MKKIENNENFTFEGTILKKCTSTDPVVIIPEGCEAIGEGAFAHLKITRVVFPTTLVAVKRNAFLGCESLKDVKFNNRLKIIEYNAFKDCFQLENNPLPKGLMMCSYGAFDGAKHDIHKVFQGRKLTFEEAQKRLVEILGIKQNLSEIRGNTRKSLEDLTNSGVAVTGRSTRRKAEKWTSEVTFYLNMANVNYVAFNCAPRGGADGERVQVCNDFSIF